MTRYQRIMLLISAAAAVLFLLAVPPAHGQWRFRPFASHGWVFRPVRQMTRAIVTPAPVQPRRLIRMYHYPNCPYTTHFRQQIAPVFVSRGYSYDTQEVVKGSMPVPQYDIIHDGRTVHSVQAMTPSRAQRWLNVNAPVQRKDCPT